MGGGEAGDLTLREGGTQGGTQGGREGELVSSLFSSGLRRSSPQKEEEVEERRVT